MRKVRVKNLPKDKGWKEYKTPTGESLYLDPRFKDQRYYVNEKGDHVTPDQNMSLYDVENNIWESGTSLPTLEVSPRYKYVQRPGSLGSMETTRIDLDNGSQQVVSPDVMATKREMDSFSNSFNPAGLFVQGAGNIAQGNIGAGALQTALSIPVVGQAVGNVIGAPFKFAGKQVAQTYGPALSEVGQYLTTQTPLKNAFKYNPWSFNGRPGFYYRGLGRSGYDAAMEQKILSTANKTGQYGEDLYMTPDFRIAKGVYSRDAATFKGDPFGNGWDDWQMIMPMDSRSYIAEIPKSAMTNEIANGPGIILNRGALPLDNINFYREHWLQGYKKLPKPSSSDFKLNIDSGVGSLGSQLYNSQQQEPVYKKGFVSFKNGGPKPKGKEYKTPAGQSIYLDPDFKLYARYKDENGNVIPTTELQKFSMIYDPQANTWDSTHSETPLQVNEHRLTREDRINKWLGNPMDKARIVAEKLSEAGEEPIDNIRHPLAGMYTAQAIANKTGNIPYISPALGWLGSNAMGIGHELATIMQDGRPWKQKGREALEDIFNNNAGATMSLMPIPDAAKEEALFQMSFNNKLPDGIVHPEGKDFYFKKDGGNINMKKVRITGLPKAAMGGFPYNQTAPNYLKDDMGEKHMRIGKVLEGVPRDQANIEAEKGETVVIPNVGGLSAHYKIGGKRHHSGGTPLNVPEDSFIFSDTKAMKIKDPDLLKEFGMPEKKGGYTPAEIAKKYDINKYREILQDPEQDNLAKDTAEKMIKSFNLKLGKLALVQEAIKGFPTGIPLIALPYMEANSIEPEDILPDLNKEEQNSETEVLDNDAEEMMDENPEIQRYGGMHKKGNLDIMSKLKKVRVNMNTMMDPNNGLYIMEPGGSAPPSNQKTKVVNKKAKIPSDAIIIKKADYKTDAEYVAARDKAFKEAADKSKVFIDLGDGNYKRVQSKAFQFPEYKGTDLDKAFKGNKEIANRYQYIEDRILGNPELKQKLYDETIAILEETKKKLPKSITSRAVKVENIDNLIANLDPDTVAKNFLEMQKRNLALSSHLGAEGVKGSAQTPISGATSNEVLTKAAADAGINMPDALGTVLQQASYVAFDNLADRKEAPGFKPGQFGAADEKKGKKLTISPVDAIYTNTTSGQITGIAGEDSIEETDPDMEEIKDESDPYRTKDPLDGYYPQDEANLALALRNKYRAKKYMPWVAPVNLQQPDIVYHDPTAAQQRALSAYNTGVRGANVYGTGNSSGRLSEFMKKAMENSALIEAQTQQADVAVTNQFNAQKADTWNKSQFANADIGTSLYDKVIAANQAYDNTNTANDQLVTQMKNAMETNAAYTYNINSMNPNFQIDPRRKGRVRFYQGSKMNPGQSQTFADIYADLRTNENLTTLDDETLAEIAKEQAGITTSSTKNKGDNNPNASYMAMYNQIYPGQVGPPMLQEESKD